MCRVEGNKREKKWDNCNSIINKIYFTKKKGNLVGGSLIKELDLVGKYL